MMISSMRTSLTTCNSALDNAGCSLRDGRLTGMAPQSTECDARRSAQVSETERNEVTDIDIQSAQPVQAPDDQG